MFIYFTVKQILEFRHYPVDVKKKQVKFNQSYGISIEGLCIIVGLADSMFCHIR